MYSDVLFLVLALALSPVLAALVRPVVRIPLVVLEIGLGFVLGPSVLNLIHDHELVNQLSEFGLAMLFFMAGMEIDFRQIAGRPLRRAATGWLISIVGGVLAGLVLGANAVESIYIGVALSSTALGTLLPTLIDSGELRSPFGTAVLAVGAVGEFGPLVTISVFLSSREALRSTVVLLGFVVVAIGAIFLAARGQHRHLHGLMAATLNTSGQFAVRMVLLILAALVALSVWLGLDMLLGAFAAGVLVQYLLEEAEPSAARQVHSKLNAVAFGLFVPIFFVATGVNFDVAALVGERFWWLLVPVVLILLLVLRGLPGLLSSPNGASTPDKRALVLFTATGLPIIVAVITIGVARHELSPGIAAVLVGAGLVSVLVFPLVAMAHRHHTVTTSTVVDSEF